MGKTVTEVLEWLNSSVSIVADPLVAHQIQLERFAESALRYNDIADPAGYKAMMHWLWVDRGLNCAWKGWRIYGYSYPCLC